MRSWKLKVVLISFFFSFPLNISSLKRISSMAKDGATKHVLQMYTLDHKRNLVKLFIVFVTINALASFVHSLIAICILSKHPCTQAQSNTHRYTHTHLLTHSLSH